MKLKKLFFVGLFSLGISVLCNAQMPQVNNGGFESWDNLGADNVEPSNWNSFMTANSNYLTQFGKKKRINRSDVKRPGSTGSYSALIWSTNEVVAIANGNFTTGKINMGSTSPANSANYNFTSRSENGFYHSFTGHPDSLVVWVRFKPSSGGSEQARINAIIHDGYDVKDPSDAGSTSHIVGVAMLNFPKTNGLWVRKSIPFNYSGPSVNPQYLLISMTTNMTPGGGSAGDSLYVDDMQLIYNPVLTTGTISPGTYTVDASNGAAISIPFTLTGTMNAGNIVTAQLSNSSGSFSTPVVLGTLATTTSGTISGTIPAGTLTGSGYRVRVVSSNYAITAADNGSDISINNITSTGHGVSGKTVYTGKANTGNPAPNPPTYNSSIYNIDNVTVILKNYPAETEVARDTSDASGNFHFDGIADGDYMLSYDKYTIDSMVWGNDANAIDVALIKYYIGSDPTVDQSRDFSINYKKAANVDNNAFINAVDVARLKAKIGSPYNVSKNFPKGNWVACDTVFTVAGSDLHINLKTICYGDFNASSNKYRDSLVNWSAAKSFPENMITQANESITTSSHDYFEVPLRISTKMNDFSALGLELNYPNKEYKLVSAIMSKTGNKNTVKINPTLNEILNDDNDLLVTDEDGIIRVVYATTNPFDVAANDEVIRLGFQSLHDLKQGELDFDLYGTGVIGNMLGEKNKDAYLTIPKIVIQGSVDAGFDFTGYPNPFNEILTFFYSLPENGKVKITMYNANGKMIRELINETQIEGKHSIKFIPENLPAGMYTFKLEYTGDERSECRILKFIH